MSESYNARRNPKNVVSPEEHEWLEAYLAGDDAAMARAQAKIDAASAVKTIFVSVPTTPRVPTPVLVERIQTIATAIALWPHTDRGAIEANLAKLMACAVSLADRYEIDIRDALEAERQRLIGSAG